MVKDHMVSAWKALATKWDNLDIVPKSMGQENRSYGRRDSLRWPRDTLYPLKLAPASLTGGDRSIGIVR
jgi:hypothetical protein